MLHRKRLPAVALRWLLSSPPRPAREELSSNYPNQPGHEGEPSLRSVCKQEVFLHLVLLLTVYNRAAVDAEGIVSTALSRYPARRDFLETDSRVVRLDICHLSRKLFVCVPCVRVLFSSTLDVLPHRCGSFIGTDKHKHIPPQPFWSKNCVQCDKRPTLRDCFRVRHRTTANLLASEAERGRDRLVIGRQGRLRPPVRELP